MVYVDVYDGRLHHDVVDLSFPARDKILGPFQVKRSYVSGDPCHWGHFGQSWTWSFDAQVHDVNGDGSTFVVREPDNEHCEYVKSGSYDASNTYSLDWFASEPFPGGERRIDRRVMRGENLTFLIAADGFSGPLAARKTFQGTAFTPVYSQAFPPADEIPQEINDDWGRKFVINQIQTANGPRISRIDAYEGGINCGHMNYGYDSFGRLTSATDAENNETLYEYVGESAIYLHRIITPEQRTETFGYDTDPESDNFKRCMSLDHMGETDRWFISYEYHPSKGMAILKYYAIPLLGQGPLRTEEVTWSTSPDLPHTVLSNQDPNGQWIYEYDDDGRLTREAEVSGDVLNKEFLYEYNETGLRSAKVNPRGFRTEFGYSTLANDPYQNILSSETWDSAGLSYTQLWAHDEVGNSTSVAWYDGDPSVGGRLVRQIRYEFGPTASFPNNHTLMTQMLQNPDALGGGVDQVTQFEYDQYGNNTKEVDPLLRTTKYTYEEGEIKNVEDALGRIRTYHYDGVKRLTSIELPKATATAPTPLVQIEYDRDGALTCRKDPLLNETRYAYAAGTTQALLKSVEQDVTLNIPGLTGPEVADDLAMAVYSYDPLDKRTSVTDANGHQTLYAYDWGKDRLTSITDAETNCTQFLHDDLGRMIEKVGPNGQASCYTYDGNDNVVQKDYYAVGLNPQLDPPTETVIFGFDSLDRKTLVEGTCCLVNYHFDALDQLTSEMRSTGEEKHYSYDAIGNRTTMTSSDGVRDRSFTYTYDKANQLRTMSEVETSRTVSYDYTEVGYVSEMVYPNGMIAAYEFDDLDRITKLTNKRADGSVVSRFSYSHDLASRTTGLCIERESRPADEITYGYDEISRLTSEKRMRTGLADPVYEYSWGYDLVGNRTLQVYTEAGVTKTSTYDYSAADRLRGQKTYIGWIDPGNEISAISYDYDANGNLIWKDEDGAITTYEWDFENRLTRVNLPDTRVVEFDYCDGCSLGKRLKKRVIDGASVRETSYIWDGLNIIGENEGSDEVDYLVMPEKLMGNTVSIRAGGQEYCLLYDAMGTVYQVVDSSGIVKNSYDYDGWGQIREQSELIANPFRWQTKPWDEEVGLYYSRSRYYEPGAGRFLSADIMCPMAGHPALGGHWYAFPGNNPVNYSDPLGTNGSCSDRTAIGKLWDWFLSWKDSACDKTPGVAEGAGAAKCAVPLTKIGLTEVERSKLCNSATSSNEFQKHLKDHQEVCKKLSDAHDKQDPKKRCECEKEKEKKNNKKTKK